MEESKLPIVQVRGVLPQRQRYELRPWAATPLIRQVTVLSGTAIVAAAGLPQSMAQGDRLLVMAATVVPGLLLSSLVLGWKRETRRYIVPIGCLVSMLLSAARFVLFDF